MRAGLQNGDQIDQMWRVVILIRVCLHLSSSRQSPVARLLTYNVSLSNNKIIYQISKRFSSC